MYPFLLVLPFLFVLIRTEEKSRHEFLDDELDHKLQLLKHDLQSIENFVRTNLLNQEENVENSTAFEEEYEDYQPGKGLEEEDYNYEYEEYDYGSSGSEEGGSPDVSSTESNGSEELVTRPATISDLTARYIKKRQQGKGNQKKNNKRKSKGKKVKKGKKEKKVKKGEKRKQQKKQKGLSAQGDEDDDDTPKLTKKQIRRLCSSQRRGEGYGGGEDGLRGISGGGQSNPNRFAQQFQQLTESFNQLQAALEAARKTPPIPVPAGSSSGQSESAVDRGSGTDQESGVGPLVQAAIGAQSAAANALRGLLPSGQ